MRHQNQTYPDECAIAHCQLHGMESQPLRSGVLISWILVQVERKEEAEILEEPFALLELCGDRAFCGLGILLSVHNHQVAEALKVDKKMIVGPRDGGRMFS